MPSAALVLTRVWWRYQQPWLAALHCTLGLTKFDIYARADPTDEEQWEPEPEKEEEEEEEEEEPPKEVHCPA
eukprot:3932955-Rhodomonas_salina.3